VLCIAETRLVNNEKHVRYQVLFPTTIENRHHVFEGETVHCDLRAFEIRTIKLRLFKEPPTMPSGRRR
jgi:hypothetical protein